MLESPALIALALLQVAAPPEWEDPAVFERNREPPHASYVPYDTVENALARRPEASPWVQSLNGSWRFHYAPKPSVRPAQLPRGELRRERLG